MCVQPHVWAGVWTCRCCGQRLAGLAVLRRARPTPHPAPSPSAVNPFGGGIPPGWANRNSAPSLEIVKLQSMQLNGTLPSEWGTEGGLQKLRQLWLDGNELSGTIPASWASLPALEQVYVKPGNPKLCGPLPPGINFKARALRTPRCCGRCSRAQAFCWGSRNHVLIPPSPPISRPASRPAALRLDRQCRVQRHGAAGRARLPAVCAAARPLCVFSRHGCHCGRRRGRRCGRRHPVLCRGVGRTVGPPPPAAHVAVHRGGAGHAQARQ